MFLAGAFERRFAVRGQHQPVIVLSAHAMRGDEERARASGCDDFMTKPIDETLLFQKIARHLG